MKKGDKVIVYEPALNCSSKSRKYECEIISIGHKYITVDTSETTFRTKKIVFENDYNDYWFWFPERIYGCPYMFKSEEDFQKYLDKEKKSIKLD